MGNNMMENLAMKIYSKSDNKLYMKVTPGHFATNHSHVNYYIDMTGIKHHYQMAKEAAVAMASAYSDFVRIDTVVCMDEMEMIGGLFARELTKLDRPTANNGGDICVVSPEFNNIGQLIFQENIHHKMLKGKNIVLMLASATTGKTINRTLECIKYYGGNTIGISAIFSAIDEKQGIPVHPIFVLEDIPDYSSYSFDACPFCKQDVKIDALVNGNGYSYLL